jgi:hypothetical protein
VYAYLHKIEIAIYNLRSNQNAHFSWYQIRLCILYSSPVLFAIHQSFPVTSFPMIATKHFRWPSFTRSPARVGQSVPFIMIFHKFQERDRSPFTPCYWPSCSLQPSAVLSTAISPSSATVPCRPLLLHSDAEAHSLVFLHQPLDDP